MPRGYAYLCEPRELLTPPEEECLSSSIQSECDFCVALPAVCCVMIARLLLVMCEYDEVSCIGVVLATPPAPESVKARHGVGRLVAVIYRTLLD